MRVALLGCGTVGSEVVRLLHTSADDLTARVGAPLELAGIAVRRLGKRRDLDVDELTRVLHGCLLTPRALLAGPDLWRTLADPFPRWEDEHQY